MQTPNWLALCILLMALGSLLRLRELVVLPAFLLTILGVAWAWQRHVLDRVSYRRLFRYRRAFPGERLPLTLIIENLKLTPVPWLRALDPWPRAVGPVDESILAPSSAQDEGVLTNVFSLKWFERVRRSYELLCRRRGIYKVGPAQLSSGDLFGLYEAELSPVRADLIVVYPEIKPLADLGFPAEDPFGDRPSRRRMFEDPARVMGVRDYAPTDSIRRIHWTATARIGALQVKEYEPTTARNLVVCLNVATFEQHWLGVDSTLLEALVGLSASIIYAAAADGYSVGLYSNGCLAHADQPFRLQPSRSPDQLGELLQALAGVTPFVTGAYERFLLEAAPRIPFGSLLVLVTAIIKPELPESLLYLRRRGRRVVLVALTADSPPPVPDILIYHLPHLREPESSSGCHF